MADFCFNISKGSVAELSRKVDAGDPAACQLVIIAIAAGAATDDAMGDTDTITALLATAAAETTNTGYARIDLDDADVTITVDDSGNQKDVDIPDQSWTLTADGNDITDIVIAFDLTGSDADSALQPLTCHDFVITADGSLVNLLINSGGFFSAS